MVSFQYFSDIHSEFLSTSPGKINKFNIQPNAPYLILSGDIGNFSSSITTTIYKNFIRNISTKFEKIFIISGNHEYYDTQHNWTPKSSNGNWMQYIDDTIKDITSKYKNVIFLQNNSYDIENTNLTIFGGTFWSQIRQNEPVERAISDYSLIPGFSTNMSSEMHNNSIASLTSEMQSKQERDFIVVSHHLPSYSLINSKYKYFSCNSAFASDIEIAKDSRIKAWFFGHTHIPTESGKFHANPIGYPGENYNLDFNKIVDV